MLGDQGRGRLSLALDDVSVGYGGEPVLSRLDLRLDSDDRIALLGANGNGKSTFVKLLAGRLKTMDGKLVKSSRLRVGYFAQDQARTLDLTVGRIVVNGAMCQGCGQCATACPNSAATATRPIGA